MTGLVPVIHVGPRSAGERFVAAGRLEAGLTQQEFARAAGASLGTVRKWERGERSPSGAARMLAPILARDPALVIAEAGLTGGRGSGGVRRHHGRDRIECRARLASRLAHLDRRSICSTDNS
jgi:transcriptional regulator with XRE-family HTH domain